jgi:von Willebrand factor type A domain
MTLTSKTPAQGTPASQNKINHIVLILDASSSMTDHVMNVVKVADTQIASLAEQSKINDQETRVTVYTFSYSTEIHCLIYDKDVLRLPSIAGLYKTYGRTALASAVTLAINDLKMTPEKYGEHSFLIYLITDGLENESPRKIVMDLPGLINFLPEHWTLAAFAPDATAKHHLKNLGFANDNITIWDPYASFEEVGQVIQTANSSFMQQRSVGVRGTKSLFNLKQASINDIKSALTPLTKGSYTLNPVGGEKVRIDEFVEKIAGSYTPSLAYYEMTQRVRIQGYKKIAILVEKDDEVYMGDAAREIVGLPTDGITEVRVSPGAHPGYRIFIQSTSFNRHLLPNSRLLLMR